MYQEANDENCFTNAACRIQAKKSFIALGPTQALADITDPDWTMFDQFLMLTSWSISRSDDTTEEDLIGYCDPVWKNNRTTWTFSGDAYYCKEDISICRVALENNCFAFMIIPCGEPYLHDLGDNNPKPDVPDGPVFGDPIGAGDVVTVGIGTANQYDENYTPGDCVRSTFSGLAKCVRKYNTCNTLVNETEQLIEESGEFVFNDDGFLVPERVAA